MNETIIHNRNAQRFEVAPTSAPNPDQTPRAAPTAAVCDYVLKDGVATFHHTQVPAALQGRGIAGELVSSALTWARNEGIKVRPTCSYVAAYIRRHPEHADLLTA
ncbi:MAG: GNAT family N-acetyltransferase [Rubrivivax sp.]